MERAMDATQAFGLGAGVEAAGALAPAEGADTMLAEFDLEVQGKVEQLRSLAEGLAVSLENAFHVQLMKLPKKIRTLSMGEFCEKYAGDLQQVYDEQLQRVVQDLAQEEDAAQALSAQRYNTMSRSAAARAAAQEASGSNKFNTWNDSTRKASAKKARVLRSAHKAPSTAKGASGTPSAQATRATRATRSAVKSTPSAAGAGAPLAQLPNFSTPAAFGAAGVMPGSSMKTPRLPQVGELAYSANGSPIGALTAARATVKRHRPQATIELEIEEGLTLDATSLMTLPDEQKQVGIEKLRELQLQVNTLMSQFV